MLESNAEPIRVYAAASTEGVMSALERRYEILHPGFDVVIEYGDSEALAERIVAGEAVDVFVAAKMEHRETVENARSTHRSRPFAVSELVIAHAKKNPKKVRDVDDLARKNMRVLALPADSSLGALTREALTRLEKRKRIEPNLVDAPESLEDTLEALRNGEADAAILSKADVKGKSKIRHIEMPVDADAQTTYHVVPMQDGEQPDQAQKIVAFFASKHAKTTLQKHGFRGP